MKAHEPAAGVNKHDTKNTNILQISIMAANDNRLPPLLTLTARRGRKLSAKLVACLADLTPSSRFIALSSGNSRPLLVVYGELKDRNCDCCEVFIAG